MEIMIAMSFCVELNPAHLKQDGKLSPSVVLAKFATKNCYRTITKDLWGKIHPSSYCCSNCCFISIRQYLSLPRTTDATGTTGKSKNFSLICARFVHFHEDITKNPPFVG